jgi:hypothetical protein
MPSSEILHCVALVKTSIPPKVSSYKSHKAKIPEDSVLHSHCCENLKSHMLSKVRTLLGMNEKLFGDYELERMWKVAVMT